MFSFIKKKKNVIQGNKIQVSTDDLTWASKHMYWAFYISFINDKGTTILKKCGLPAYNWMLVIAPNFILQE